MGVLLCVILMVEVACTAVTGEVSLSVDALPIQGGYVVPKGGNITLTCNSSSNGVLLWRVNLTEMNDIENPITAFTLNGVAGFNSSDTPGVNNPASFTFYNISFENSPSVVECTDLSDDPNGVSRATIIVEGSPNCSCPTVNTTVATSSLTVSIQNSQMMRLPEWYCVQVISYNGSIALLPYNSTLKDTTSFEVTPLEPDTVYNITVIPCNMAGCNESCDVHSVQTDSEMNMEVPTGSGGTPRAVTVQPYIIFIGVAILVTMVLLLLIASIPVGCIIRRKRGKQTIPQTSNVDAVHVHHASLQLQDRDVTSATAAQYINVGVTSSDITMEDNPAYQSIAMESARSDYN